MGLMCMPYEGMPDDYADGLEKGATIISRTFMAEMAFKLFGLGCAAYWSDKWNVRHHAAHAPRSIASL